MMPTPHPEEVNAYVRYYYLPARNQKGAEIIEVLNSDAEFVKVPTRQEDIRLRSFFQRRLSNRETEIYEKSQTWKIFTSWEELQQDHERYGITAGVLKELLGHRLNLVLQEEIAA